jgi:Protein kinase domain
VLHCTALQNSIRAAAPTGLRSCSIAALIDCLSQARIAESLHTPAIHSTISNDINLNNTNININNTINNNNNANTKMISLQNGDTHRKTHQSVHPGKRSRPTQSLSLPKPSAGARLSFEELTVSPPQPPPPETSQAVIYPAIRCPPCQVLPADPDEDPPPVFLTRLQDPTKAYAKIPRPPISLDHHGHQWGSVYFAVVYPRVDEADGLVFQAPSGERQSHYVAIKQLRKSVLYDYQRAGGHENPYVEIARMQELGDNQHVLECIEALEDDDYLYIVTPKASAEGTLKDAIAWLQADPMEPERARELFVQVLNILAYLERHGVCHRDMSPDNFIFLSPHRLVAFDFALSHRIPVDPATGKRTLVEPLGNFGTRAYMAPEVYKNLVFDSVGSDLWSVLVILYNCMTNQPLYYLPHPADTCFRYFIMARGLSSLPLNEKTVEILQSTFNGKDAQTAQHDLLTRAMANLNISPVALEVFENAFRVDPSKRWTLAQVMESRYVCGEE